MKRFLIGLVSLLGHSVAAMAQSDAPPLLITGAFFSGIERLSHQETTEPVPFEIDLSGTTTGGSLAVGTFLSPRWSVQLEFAFPSALETSFTPPVTPGAPSPPFTQHIQLESRRKTGAILVGYRTPRRRRVSAEYLGGLAFAWCAKTGPIADLSVKTGPSMASGGTGCPMSHSLNNGRAQGKLSP